MDPKTYPEWQRNLLKQLVSTTKAASAIASHDLSFERSIDTAFDSSLSALTDRLLTTTNELLKFAGHSGEEFDDADDLDNRWGDIVDVVDSLLERAVYYPRQCGDNCRILV
jgi:exosome complex exonuclease RRP6